MPRHHLWLVPLAALCLLAFSAGETGAQARPAGQRGRGGQAARDTRAMPTGTGAIAGRVLAADTARPVKRARVVVAGQGNARTTTTDAQGRFLIGGLPAGSYTVTAVKTGFIDGVFGQRRALRAGTPIQVADGQQVAGTEIRLIRGGVITGHVFDEDGEPLSRSTVTVLRSQYVRGEKQLAPAGADQSDDRGQFRIFGLPPGEYVVSASAGGLDRMVAQLVERRGGVAADESSETSGYAPTYFPGVTTASDSRRLRLAAAQELSGIDFSIQVVPLSTVRGIVSGGEATVMLVPDSGITGGGRGGGGRGVVAAIGGQNFRSGTQSDGSFAIRNVTPGRYTIVARTNGGNGMPRMAMQSITVAGEDVTVALNPVGGATLSGTITLEAQSTPVPSSLSGFRVALAPLDVAIPGIAGRLLETTATGQFTIGNVFPARYGVRATAPRGWILKTVYLDGREVTDHPIEIGSDSVGGLNLIFTDRIAEIAGTVRDRSGLGVEAMTVVAFPQDETRWQPESRLIVTARSDRSGVYRIGGLPGGDYFIVAVDDVEPGEWFDPEFLDRLKDGAARVTIGDGEQRSQDLKVLAGAQVPGALF